MGMWDPYIKAVPKKVPHVKIVFDLFHVFAQFSRVIGGPYKQTCQLGLQNSFVAGAPKASDDLNPPEDLFHWLSDLLA